MNLVDKEVGHLPHIVAHLVLPLPQVHLHQAILLVAHLHQALHLLVHLPLFRGIPFAIVTEEFQFM